MARPSIYDERKVQRILERIADGQSVEKACKSLKLKKSTFMVWVIRDYHGLADRFYAAMQAKYLVEVDRCVELTDSVLGAKNLPEVIAAKNSADSRRWVAGRIIKQLRSEDPVHPGSRVNVVISLPPLDPIEGSQPKLIEGRAVDLLSAGSDEKPEEDGQS